jgi:thiol:disulfide interchange protein
MTFNRTMLPLGFCLGLLADVAIADTPAKPVAPTYTVDVYDPKRNAADDLQTTIAKAKAGKKRILIQVGGEWCSWCHLMSKYFHENEKVAKALASDYVIMKVNYSDDNQNEEFLGKFPKVGGYPHLYVLDASGKLLHSQNTEELEEGKGYSERAMLEFLRKWAPKN